MKKIKLVLTIILSALIFSACTFLTYAPDEGEILSSVQNGEKVEKNDEKEEKTGTESTEKAENNRENTEKGQENAPEIGEKSEKNDENNTESSEKSEEKIPASAKEDKSKIDGSLSASSWIISPSYTFDSLETFGMTGYSIYKKNGKTGIIDMNASGIGTGDYSALYYCDEHGLSCPDILDTPIKMRDDLYLSPDCGYRENEKDKITYVFDNTRDRIYAAGYSDGVFRLADITDTGFFDKNSDHIVVLYNCDSDLMMYEGIGMKSLEDVFRAENIVMRYGVIDGDMDYVIACVYEEIRDGNDCYIVKKDGKYGYRALNGRQYYPCVFDYANTAYKGAAWVKYGGKWGTVRF